MTEVNKKVDGGLAQAQEAVEDLKPEGYDEGLEMKKDPQLGPDPLEEHESKAKEKQEEAVE